MDIDPEQISAVDLYRIFTATVLPRPIAWVSTINATGGFNLAPFSFFTVASVSPPILCFSSLVDRDRGVKDTLANIRATKQFVVNIVNQDLSEKMNNTAAPWPAGISEFIKADLSPCPASTIATPGVEESPAKFECRLLEIIPLGTGIMAGNLVLGQVCGINLSDELIIDGKINSRRLDAVGRMDGCDYTTTRERFTLPRADIE